MRIPILAYDSMRVHGNDYGNNQLRALASDIEQLTDAGFRIVALRSVVDAWLDNRANELAGKVAVLTCDHGSDFDYFDLPHPTAGTQRSALNILRDFARLRPGAQPELNITSFVVVCAEARAVLDSTCMIGKGWWTDGWWTEAVASGLMHIANNSWDHHHETLPESFSLGVARGTFATIDRKDLADAEIAIAAQFLRKHAPNPGAELFAYPYGVANSYLMYEYFPRHGATLCVKAAFTTHAGYLEVGTSKWDVPRFLCGRDWNSPAELGAILDAARDAPRTWVPPRRAQEASQITAMPVTDAQREAERGTASPASIVDEEGFRSRFEMVPQVVSEWVGAYRQLEGLDILDFGCGEGISALGLALNHKPRRVVGVDIGPDPKRCLPTAQARIGLGELPRNLELHRIRPGFLHNDEDRFDVAYSWSVFEHVDERLIARALDSIRSSLRRGGLFLVQIAPLYYSPEGSHLSHKLPEPWVHLLTQHNALREALRCAVPDEMEFSNLWGTYTTLNRMTGKELVQHIEGNGFEILRTWVEKDPRPPPPRLKAIFAEDVLCTHQIVVLARPA